MKYRLVVYVINTSARAEREHVLLPITSLTSAFSVGHNRQWLCAGSVTTGTSMHYELHSPCVTLCTGIKGAPSAHTTHCIYMRGCRVPRNLIKLSETPSTMHTSLRVLLNYFKFLHHFVLIEAHILMFTYILSVNSPVLKILLIFL